MLKTLASLVGIDVAKATLDLACQTAPDKYRTRSKLPNTPAGFAPFGTVAEFPTRSPVSPTRSCRYR